VTFSERDLRALQNPTDESERSFQQRVVDLATSTGWLVYHTWNSQFSAAGFPDIQAVRGPRLVIAELKPAEGRRYVSFKAAREREEWLAHRDVSDPQTNWLRAFKAVGVALAAAADPDLHAAAGYPTIETYLWRPADMDLIQRVFA
jgi:hypothetical protein